MSIRVTSRVWDDQTITDQSELLVLLAIADFCNDDGEAWPSVNRIAQKARICERTARYKIRLLQEKGRLIVDTGGGRGTNRYHVILPTPANPAPLQTLPPTPAPNAPHPCNGLPPTPATAIAPNPSLTVIEPKRWEQQGSLPLNGTSCRKPFRKPTQDEVQLAASKIGLPPDEAERFVDHYESIGWKSGRTPIVDWQARMRTWKKNWECHRQPVNSPVVRVSKWGQPIDQRSIAEKEIDSILRSLSAV